jgi:hypothetical protein
MPLLEYENELVRRIRRNPSLSLAGIGYEGGRQSRVLSEPPIPASGNLWVVIEETTINQDGLAQLEQLLLSAGGPSRTQPTTQQIPRESRWGRELVGAGFSCGAMVLAGAAVSAGGAAAPVTGGASVLLSVAAWTGLVTSSLQCGIGLGRLGNEIFNPDQNDRLDADLTYQRITFGIDLLGVASGIVSAGPMLSRFALRLNARLGGRAAQVLASETAQGLQTATVAANRIERARAVRQVLSEMTDVERLALMREAGVGQAVMRGRDSLSVVGARRIISAIEAQQLSSDLREIVMLGVQTGVNFLPSRYVGVASGTFNSLFVDSDSQIRQDIRWISANIVILN